MTARVHSRFGLRTLPKLRRCAEALTACEWTCGSRSGKGHPTPVSDGPGTIPQRPRTTASAKPQVNEGNLIGGLFHLAAHGVGANARVWSAVPGGLSCNE
jgi:hypothetical protein